MRLIIPPSRDHSFTKERGRRLVARSSVNVGGSLVNEWPPTTGSDADSRWHDGVDVALSVVWRQWRLSGTYMYMSCSVNWQAWSSRDARTCDLGRTPCSTAYGPVSSRRSAWPWHTGAPSAGEASVSGYGA